MHTATNFDTIQSGGIKHYPTGYETPAPNFLEEDTSFENNFKRREQDTKKKKKKRGLHFLKIKKKGGRGSPFLFFGNTPGGPTPMGPDPEEEKKNGTRTKRQKEEEEENEEEEEDDPFPHNDYSRIDFRTLKPGDGKTYPLAYSVVKFKYMGYIHHRDTGRWEQFTHSKTTNRVYSTRLSASSQVPGFEEALLTMSVGEQAKVWVPSRLGYGVYGAGSLVPPFSDLVFIITLLAVEEDNEGNNSQFQTGADNQGSKHYQY
ncbi:hypothetical protein RFI_17102 [Reticulomyxa filosa]|uniref:peptidylprolyl isomerase n=1 Tax=Reticulomyxa filosa TaxID=46433 RepID=X6N1F9_RETFI|nr:hypothetical protein RFI_17102 [Reticulomyxa filosa]|eukprot:ETO20115.1 hypothetical protein RFI_17102 [Reticulomyxa filosa]